jgi:hypothetical protein
MEKNELFLDKLLFNNPNINNYSPTQWLGVDALHSLRSMGETASISRASYCRFIWLFPWNGAIEFDTTRQ